MFTIIWTDHALQDLDTIYIFLAENSQRAASQLIFKILDRVKQLEEFPESVKSNCCLILELSDIW